MESFHGYSIDSLDPTPYFQDSSSLWEPAKMCQMLTTAESVDQMYRERYPPYMRFVRDFVDKFKDADLVVLATYNPIHPEILYNELSKPIKVLGFIDEPRSTYIRGIPYLWAFDAAFYITPSFNENALFEDALKHWGCEQSYWLPQVPPIAKESEPGSLWPLTGPRLQAVRQGDRFFRERDIDLIYVGQHYGPKVNRLIQLKKSFGSRFKIYGRWPLAGYSGAARLLKGKPPLWSRVRSISDPEKTDLYYRTKIGFNMHLSNIPRETGNMRMYEVPAHGMMLLCDKAGLNAHERIFEPDKEAIFYDSIEDAIEKIMYYLKHDEERERIARAGFARVQRDYDGEANLKKFLDWVANLRKRKERP